MKKGFLTCSPTFRTDELPTAWPTKLVRMDDFLELLSIIYIRLDIYIGFLYFEKYFGCNV